MSLIPKSFWKSLGVGLAGLLAFSLLVFFVVMFFGGHRNTYFSANDSVIGRGMMTSPLNTVVSNTSNKNKKIARMSSVPVTTDMMGGTATSVMMEGRAAAPMMATGTKMMKDASMSLQVGNVDETVVKIHSIASEMGGSVTQSYFNQTSDSVKTGSMTINVPVASFEETFVRLKTVATVVLSENVSGTDVTEQYIDIDARLNNKRAAEAAFQALLEKAEKINDIIEITDSLSVVRGEIESLEGQLRYLVSQTDRASITVFMTEDAKIVSDQNFRPGQTFKESIVMLFRVLGHFVQGIIMLMIMGLPIILIYGLILWIVYKIVRKMVIRFWPDGLEEKKKAVRRRVN